MAEYIERTALLNEIAELHSKHKLPDDEEMLFTESDIRGLVMCLPAAEVEPVRHGHWIFKRQYHDADECNCSNCGQLMTTVHGVRMAYCPQCGFIMDGGADNGEAAD